jgi:tRNA-Thr(GGU) m(6)t(6)A37 methyltransferase TsaA
MEFEPIGIFRCAAVHPFDAARQPAASVEGAGTVELYPGQDYEQAVRGLAGFSHVWLVYVFHHNTHWKPVVQPPRAPHKVGVFASRAPYRPNPIGLSCVELRAVHGRTLTVGAHDLLDGTPILDIKPYLPYADSMPHALTGWLEDIGEMPWMVTLAAEAEERIDWLEAHGVNCLRAFLRQQLVERPFDAKRKRIKVLAIGHYEIAYRTWRARYRAHEDAHAITVEEIASGYTAEDLAREEDPHGDKAAHRAFNAVWSVAPASE